MGFIVRILGLLLALFAGAAFYLYFMAPGTATELATQAQIRATGLQEKTAKVGRFEMHYLEGGNGEPLLLLHGFGANKTNWLTMIPSLTDQYRVIIPDLPGFGESDHPMGADYRVGTQVERVSQFLQAIGVDQVHIAGNSMGGAIAGVYAARFPDATRSAWLLAPAFVRTAPQSELDAQLQLSHRNPLLPATHEEVDTLIEWAFAEPPFILAPVKYHLGEVAIERRPLLADIFGQLLDENVILENAMRGTPVPTLVLWGDQDRLLHVGGAQVLGNVIPNSRVVILQNVGHVPMMEKPEASAEAFIEFQTSLNGRDGGS